VVGLDPEDLDDAAARLTAVARFLRQQDPSSPGPYLLLRGYRWGELRGYGEYPDPTMLIPPSSEVRQSVKRLALESNWGELLETAETAMAQPCGRAWMDLQRYVVRAAEESGYGAIAQAIRSELRALVADLPALTSWTLMDDTPTANPETQAWLKEVAGPPPAPPGDAQQTVASMMEEESDASAVPAGEPAPPDTFELAMMAARQGRASEAIHLLAEEIPRQRSGRARFQRKLQLAQICMMTGHEALAQPTLEELTGLIDEHKLEDWEASDVVAHPLVMLYRCLSKTESEAQVKNKLYARISRLDPVQALECVR
jgi:type VI secretion system protein ImpA